MAPLVKICGLSTPETLAATLDAGAERILPVHHQTFKLSREPYFEPIERLVDATGHNRDRVVLHRIGQEWAL